MSTSNARQESGGSSLALPPMPQSLQQIRAEQAKADPDVDRIIAIIAADVGLASEVLKTINSPAFRRARPLSSVPNAVMLLGLGNVMSIVAAVALRQTMNCGDNKLKLDRFWDTASDVAFAAAAFARELSGVSPDAAYTLGLFHDCGIPILMCRHGDYLETLKAAGRDSALTALEQARYGLNHAQVGQLVCRAWHLPTEIGTAILHHHDFPALVARNEQVDEVVVSLVGLLKMAEHASNVLRGVAFRNSADDYEWEEVEPLVLGHFDLNEDDFADLSENIVGQLGQR